MLFEDIGLGGAFLISVNRHGDSRGFFAETFVQQKFDDHAPGFQFIQDNQSLSGPKGTLRGLHFQLPPFEQGKLVRVGRGKVLDVIVDIRQGSPTFGQHKAVTLSAESGQQLWVPPGFAHGFITLESDTEFLYKVTQYYAADHDAGIAFDDAELAINWTMPANQIITSEKDAQLPRLKDIKTPFIWGENC